MNINIDKVYQTKSLKNHDTKVETLLEKSIKRYGQLYPILVDENYNIIKGNTIYKILKSLSFTEIYVKIVECENVNQLTLELNLLKGEPNPIGCFELMKDVKPDNCLPFSYKQIKDSVNLLNFDWSKYKKKKSSISDLF